MRYASYDYYTGTYNGSKVASADYVRLSAQADIYIDTITLCRLQHGAPVTDAVRLAACAAADAFADTELTLSDAGQAATLASENVDGYSVSYRTAAETRESQELALRTAVDRYLSPGDPLRYRGCP